MYRPYDNLTPLVKCPHCGQWAAVFTECSHCGAPVDPQEPNLPDFYYGSPYVHIDKNGAFFAGGTVGICAST